MFTKDVLKYCEEHGKKITKMGLIKAGKKHNFIFKVQDKNEYVFDKDKFLEWFNKANESIPEGYITIKEMRDKYNLPLNRSYEIAKDSRLNGRSIGAGRGVWYVDSTRVEEVIKNYKPKRSYKWED